MEISSFPLGLFLLFYSPQLFQPPLGPIPNPSSRSRPAFQMHHGRITYSHASLDEGRGTEDIGQKFASRVPLSAMVFASPYVIHGSEHLFIHWLSPSGCGGEVGLACSEALGEPQLYLVSSLSLLPLGLQTRIASLKLCPNDGKVPLMLGQHERILKWRWQLRCKR